jgi:hypothetical protein
MRAAARTQSAASAASSPDAAAASRAAAHGPDTRAWTSEICACTSSGSAASATQRRHAQPRPVSARTAAWRVSSGARMALGQGEGRRVCVQRGCWRPEMQGRERTKRAPFPLAAHPPILLVVSGVPASASAAAWMKA